MKDGFTLFFIIFIGGMISSYLTTLLIVEYYGWPQKAFNVVFMFLVIAWMLFYLALNWLAEKYHQWKVDRQKL